MHLITLCVQNMIIGLPLLPFPLPTHTCTHHFLAASLDSYEICPCRPTPCCNGFYGGY